MQGSCCRTRGESVRLQQNRFKFNWTHVADRRVTPALEPEPAHMDEDIRRRLLLRSKQPRASVRKRNLSSLVHLLLASEGHSLTVGPRAHSSRAKKSTLVGCGGRRDRYRSGRRRADPGSRATHGASQKLAQAIGRECSLRSGARAIYLGRFAVHTCRSPSSPRARGRRKRIR
jgi:hypothetical protein